jgi:hypothetical protein
LGFGQLGERSELLNEDQQQQLFRAGDSWPTFLMTPHNEKLLAQQQEFKGFVIRCKPTETQTVPKWMHNRIDEMPDHQ